MTAVKICGITNLEDALKAVEYGADSLGFNFYPKSQRYIKIESAKSIINELPPIVTTVGVFVNEDPSTINDIIDSTGIMVIQLHGDESQEFCKKFNHPVIKAIRITSEKDIDIMKRYNVNAFLLDTFSEEYGGSGLSFNWDIAIKAKKIGKVILAGGLTLENIEDAINTVKPYGVDVCSGVESEPGKKDHEKLKEFIKRAKKKITETLVQK